MKWSDLYYFCKRCKLNILWRKNELFECEGGIPWPSPWLVDFHLRLGMKTQETMTMYGSYLLPARQQSTSCPIQRYSHHHQLALGSSIKLWQYMILFRFMSHGVIEMLATGWVDFRSEKYIQSDPEGPGKCPHEHLGISRHQSAIGFLHSLGSNRE